jgi:hypothetical protein
MFRLPSWLRRGPRASSKRPNAQLTLEALQDRITPSAAASAHGLAIAAAAANSHAVHPITGPLFTADDQGERANIFSSTDDVFLGGSTQLPDGTYFVQVTAPGGKVLGQSSTAVVTIVNGEFEQSYQLAAIVQSASSGFTTNGFDATTNPGGLYKVLLSTSSDFTHAKQHPFLVQDATHPPTDNGGSDDDNGSDDENETDDDTDSQDDEGTESDTGDTSDTQNDAAETGLGVAASHASPHVPFDLTSVLTTHGASANPPSATDATEDDDENESDSDDQGEDENDNDNDDQGEDTQTSDDPGDQGEDTTDLDTQLDSLTSQIGH